KEQATTPGWLRLSEVGVVPVVKGVKEGGSRFLRAPVRMLPRVCAPAQALEVEVPRVAEEVPQLHEKAVGYMSQPKDSDVLTPALWAAGTYRVFGVGVCRFE